MLVGCTDADPPTSPAAAGTTSTAADDSKVIRPGYGISMCHVGMHASALTDGWKQYAGSEERSRRNTFNAALGIEVVAKDDRVMTVFFQYLSHDKQPFKGSTEKTIGSESTIEDVRKMYGEPSFITKSEQSEFGAYPGAQETRIVYEEQGIEFVFIDDKLATITVTAARPRTDYDAIEA
jgi:hypothetical protein